MRWASGVREDARDANIEGFVMVPMDTGRSKRAAGGEKSERRIRILGAVVEEYIATAEPVSSRAISERYSLGLSPATIRNIMAELESFGYLCQPHTSAGRVPTEKSFRLYIDRLLELKELSSSEMDRLMSFCSRHLDVAGVLGGTSRALSALTSCAGLVFMPQQASFVIKHIRLLGMDPASVMLVLVSTLGVVKTRTVRIGEAAGGLDLERISNYLNSIGEGLTVRALRARIIEEMEKEKNLYDELLSNALRLGAAVFEDEGEEEGALYVDGKVNVLEQPEFRDDFKKMKRLFSAFEEKSLLLRILDRASEARSVSISMGSESSIEEFRGLSFVTAPYGADGEVLGTLGVIGPVRMNYSRIVPLVAYTAGLLGKLF